MSLELPEQWVELDGDPTTPALKEHAERVQRNFEAIRAQWATGRPDRWHIVGVSGEPAFEGTWQNFDAGATRQARFRKAPDGKVTLAGIVKSGVSGTNVFTLPAGYRPLSSGGVEGWVVNASGGVASLGVSTTGAVSVTSIGGSAVATHCFLNGVEFWT